MSGRERFTVFLAGIIQGSIAQRDIHPQQWREPIKALLSAHCPEAELYCHFSANADSITYDDRRMVATFEQGNRMAAGSDLVICWLPQASMGTAVEMYLAWKAGAAVVAVTPMEANWVVRTCSDLIVADLAGLERFLISPELDAMLRRSRKRRLDMTVARQLPELDAFWRDSEQ